METDRAIVWTVTVLVALIAVAAGPLVPGFAVTEAASPSGSLGQGNATVGDVTLPDRVTFERGSFGAETYYLDVPPASVDLLTVTGRPILIYEVEVPALAYSTSRLHFVSSAQEGTYRASVPRSTFAPEEIEQSEYEVVLTVSLRNGDGERVLAERRLTVEVER